MSVGAVVISALYVMSLSVCRVVWGCSVMLPRACWVHWSSASRSISSFVVVHACRKTPTCSSSYLHHILVIIVWYVPDFNIHICYWWCVMRILRKGCLFLYIVYVHGTLLLLIYQTGPHMTCCMFCIVIYIFH